MNLLQSVNTYNPKYSDKIKSAFPRWSVTAIKLSKNIAKTKTYFVGWVSLSKRSADNVT